MNEAIIIWLYLSLGVFFKFTTFIIITVCASAALTILVSFINQSDAKSDFDFYKKYNNTKASALAEGKIGFWIGVRKKVLDLFPYKTFLVLIVLTIFYPSKSDLKYIIGGAAAWNGVAYAKDIKGVEKLPENVVNVMNSFLEDIADKEAK